MWTKEPSPSWFYISIIRSENKQIQIYVGPDPFRSRSLQLQVQVPVSPFRSRSLSVPPGPGLSRSWSALCLLGVHVSLSLQSKHHDFVALTRRHLSQVFKGPGNRPPWPTQSLLQSVWVLVLVRAWIGVRVEAGVLLDGGHARAVGDGVLGGHGQRRRAGLLGSGWEAQARWRRETGGFEDPD